MSKQDLTSYASGELSLQVFNDEGLYTMMRTDPKELDNVLRELFDFTDEQMRELCDDIQADQEEECRVG